MRAHNMSSKLVSPEPVPVNGNTPAGGSYRQPGGGALTFGGMASKRRCSSGRRESRSRGSYWQASGGALKFGTMAADFITVTAAAVVCDCCPAAAATVAAAVAAGAMAIPTAPPLVAVPCSQSRWHE